MRFALPKDRQSRINIYFLSFFLTVALLVTLVVVGMNVYESTHYSRFDLFIKGNYALREGSWLPQSTKTIHPTSTSEGITSYANLADGWGQSKPGYVIGNNFDELGFQVKSNMNGEIFLQSPNVGTNAAVIGIEIRNQQGEAVHAMVPGEWYNVRQYGKWYTIKFTWGN